MIALNWRPSVRSCVASQSFLLVQQDASEGEVDARQRDLLANREAVVPEGVGGRVHEEQASMSQLQFYRLNLPWCLFSPGISVPEDEVPRSSQRDGGDGTEWVQLPFVISVLTHVVLPVFVPGGAKETFSKEMNSKQ